MNKYISVETFLCETWCKHNSYAPQCTESTALRSGLKRANQDADVLSAASSLCNVAAAPSVSSAASALYELGVRKIAKTDATSFFKS